MRDISIYIHIPFCESKCFYCDFTSFSGKQDIVKDYMESLIRELSLYKEKLVSYGVRTIFFGGGTPSSIDPKYIRDVLNYIYDNFNTHHDMEISIELNPGTVTMEKLRIYKEAGINRISMGLQTLNDDILKKLGRVHTKNDFLDSYSMIKAIGFENINIDLIFNLPNQTVVEGLKDIETLVDLGVRHISYYSLIIEPGTQIYKWYEEGRLKLLDEDSERELYHKVVTYLKERGYNHYEISNFALKGYECKHNMVYWNINPYIGVGLSSHSNIDHKRFYNTSILNTYIQSLKKGMLPIEDEEIINKEVEIAEFCIFGLRLVEGIHKKGFKERFKTDISIIYKEIIEKHKKNGLLYEDEDYLKLTNRGLDLANIVELDFLPN